MCTRGLFFYSSSSACFTKMKRIREARGGEREAAARQKKDRRKISKVTLSTYYSSLDLEVRPWAFFCRGISPQISPSCPLGRAFGRPKKDPKVGRWGMEINAGGQHNRPRPEKRNYHLGFIFKPVSLHSSSSPYTEFFVALHNRIKEELGPA